MNPVILLFIDGVGIGKKDLEFNPFFKYGFKTFTNFFGTIPSIDNPIIKRNNGFIFPVDARMGVEGFPQSGTGQTSIFCGINAPQFVGKHFGPYPYSTLIPIINDKNIFIEFNRVNKKPFFMNAYPKVFFDYIDSGKSRLSVISLSAKLSGLKFNSIEDVQEGRALTAEITNERWNTKLGYNLPLLQPSDAAIRLLKAASFNDLIVYEYFLTDHLGHGRFEGNLEKTMDILDEFLFTIFSEADPSRHTILLCSDHGNFEDLFVKTHTLNPALTISYGKHASFLFENIKNLSDIKGSILHLQTII
ncbi:MAG: metalloenzyme [Ignavibacteriaceae bacterium]|nr:metalloenzyme [Ignavibacteriaceae bacterium]